MKAIALPKVLCSLLVIALCACSKQNQSQMNSAAQSKDQPTMESAAENKESGKSVSLTYKEFEKKSYELSDWNVSTPLPVDVMKNNGYSMDKLTKSFKIQSVLPLLTKNMPFRGTAFYLGKVKGEYLFATSAHLEIRGAFAIINTSDTKKGNEVEINGLKYPNVIKLDEKAIFSSVLGDIAVFKVDQEAMKKGPYKYKGYKKSLNSLPGLPLLGKNLPKFYKKNPKLQAMVAGRALIAYQKKRNLVPGLWKKSLANYWSDDKLTEIMDATTGSADQPMLTKIKGLLDVIDSHEDHMSADVLVATPTKIMGQGETQTILDPDGAPTLEEAAHGKENGAYSYRLDR